ncbi:MAG: mechanosensitive ion channel family protein, partial [Sinobacterium sp.]|nr:mechanosensitive ion channel family protein [Sinobacterium sp.]
MAEDTRSDSPKKQAITEQEQKQSDAAEVEVIKLSLEEVLQTDYLVFLEEIEKTETGLKENLSHMEDKKGESLISSELRQFQKGQALIALYTQVIKNLIQQESLDIDISDQKKSLTHSLLRINKRIIIAIKNEESNFRLRSQKVADNPNSFFLLFKSHNEYQTTALDALVSYNKNLNILGIQDQNAIEILHDHLTERAENLAGQIQLLSERKKQSHIISSETQKSSEKSNAIHQRFEIIETSFKKVISLLLAEKIDASNYQRILISSTGTITKDVLDIHVASALFEDWSKKIKSLVKDDGLDFLFKLLYFLTIVLIAWLISKVFGSLLNRSLNHSISKKNNLMQEMVVGLTARFIFFLGILFALSQMGISLGPILTGLGIAGFIVGFALQDTLGNFASGIMILIYRPYDIGDIVEVASSVFGSVASMNLVSTTIMTFDNQTLVLPNSKIWGDVIKNITDQEQRRVDIVFHASLDSDIDTMLALYTNCVNANDKILKLPEPTIKLHKISFNSLEFIIRAWVTTSDYWPVYWDLHEAIKRQYDQDGIAFPV